MTLRRSSRYLQHRAERGDEVLGARSGEGLKLIQERARRVRRGGRDQVHGVGESVLQRRLGHFRRGVRRHPLALDVDTGRLELGPDRLEAQLGR